MRTSEYVRVSAGRIPAGATLTTPARRPTRENLEADEIHSVPVVRYDAPDSGSYGGLALGQVPAHPGKVGNATWAEMPSRCIAEMRTFGRQ
jgi:hypothetical protein